MTMTSFYWTANPSDMPLHPSITSVSQTVRSYATKRFGITSWIIPSQVTQLRCFDFDILGLWKDRLTKLRAAGFNAIQVFSLLHCLRNKDISKQRLFTTVESHKVGYLVGLNLELDLFWDFQCQTYQRKPYLWKHVLSCYILKCVGQNGVELSIPFGSLSYHGTSTKGTRARYLSRASWTSEVSWKQLKTLGFTRWSGRDLTSVQSTTVAASLGGSTNFIHR